MYTHVTCIQYVLSYITLYYLVLYYAARCPRSENPNVPASFLPYLLSLFYHCLLSPCFLRSVLS